MKRIIFPSIFLLLASVLLKAAPTKDSQFYFYFDLDDLYYEGETQPVKKQLNTELSITVTPETVTTTETSTTSTPTTTQQKQVTIDLNGDLEYEDGEEVGSTSSSGVKRIKFNVVLTILVINTLRAL